MKRYQTCYIHEACTSSARWSILSGTRNPSRWSATPFHIADFLEGKTNNKPSLQQGFVPRKPPKKIQYIIQPGRNGLKATTNHNLTLRYTHYFLSHERTSIWVKSMVCTYRLCNNTPRAVQAYLHGVKLQIRSIVQFGGPDWLAY